MFTVCDEYMVLCDRELKFQITLWVFSEFDVNGAYI